MSAFPPQRSLEEQLRDIKAQRQESIEGGSDDDDGSGDNTGTEEAESDTFLPTPAYSRHTSYDPAPSTTNNSDHTQTTSSGSKTTTSPPACPHHHSPHSSNSHTNNCCGLETVAEGVPLEKRGGGGDGGAEAGGGGVGAGTSTGSSRRSSRRGSRQLSTSSLPSTPEDESNSTGVEGEERGTGEGEGAVHHAGIITSPTPHRSSSSRGEKKKGSSKGSKCGPLPCDNGASILLVEDNRYG